MGKTEYTDHNGNVFIADIILSCPFCGEKAEIFFIGNRATKNRKAVIKCIDKMCSAEMIKATIKHDTEWVARVSIDSWNKRVGGHGV